MAAAAADHSEAAVSGEEMAFAGQVYDNQTSRKRTTNDTITIQIPSWHA